METARYTKNKFTLSPKGEYSQEHVERSDEVTVSPVDIRLFNHDNSEVLYERLTVRQLEIIKSVLTEEWR